MFIPTSVVKRLEEPSYLAGEDRESVANRQARIGIAAPGSMKWLLGMWLLFRCIAGVFYKNVNSSVDIGCSSPLTDSCA